MPDGFVISTAAFAAAAGARSMTLEVREAIGEALKRFPEDALAVRSSSVAEDLPDAAHAGLYETVLDVREVYGAVAYYLAHRDDIDRYVEGRRQDFDTARQAARDADPMFYQKLTDAKKHTPLTR